MCKSSSACDHILRQPQHILFEIFFLISFSESEGKEKVFSKRFTAQARDGWRTHGRFRICSIMWILVAHHRVSLYVIIASVRHSVFVIWPCCCCFCSLIVDESHRMKVETK